MAATGVAQAKDLRWANDADVFSWIRTTPAEVFTFGFLNNSSSRGWSSGNRELRSAGLATTYSNPEPTRWRFEIRRGVKFHEGEALTADDVVFSFERAKLSPDMRSRVGAIKEVRKVDDFTVDFVLVQPDLIFPANIQDIYICPGRGARSTSRRVPTIIACRARASPIATPTAPAVRLSVREPE
jgi:peptide/nickel transport system substrate-binding protein